MLLRKAQAAMEFLMTYGWVIMAVLVVIGALAYFGYLNPRTIIPEQCVLSLPLECRDYQLTAASASLVVHNVGGQNIIITGVALTDSDGAGSCAKSTLSTLIQSDESASVTSGVCSNIGAGKNKYALSVGYKLETSTFEHTADGELVAEASSTASSYSICKNAEDSGLCEGLDIVFGEGYEALCCSEHGLCC